MAGPPYPAPPQATTPTSSTPHSQNNNTPRVYSIADDSETEFEPTPIHSPGGPQYDDLPPSYNEAQHQASHDSRHGIAPIDPNQIEAHRLTINEGPDEAEVWEYRVRGEEPDPVEEQEQAPDYANHTRDKATSVPVQHVASSEQIPIGRVGSERTEDPPHSIPGPPEETEGRHGPAGPDPFHPSARRGGHWLPFGTPGHGPFGAPGNGPFGAPGNGPFGRPGGGPFGMRGHGPFGRGGRGGRGFNGRRGCGPAGQRGEWQGNEWAEMGKEIGKMGEEFGKRMGDWGVQFGQRASAFGIDVGRMASGSGTQNRDMLGQSGERSSNAERMAGGSGVQDRNINESTDREAQNDLPPSYNTVAPTGQESGILHRDRKVDVSDSSTSKEKGKGKAANPNDYDSDDLSSISSTDLDSSSDSDSDDEDDHHDTDAIYAARLRSIEASSSTTHERTLAIERAQHEKEIADLKIASKLSKRAARTELRYRHRELKRQHRARKRELRAEFASKGDGKGKGKEKKVKKSREWKEEKRVYREKKRELKREKRERRREWREGKREIKGM